MGIKRLTQILRKEFVNVEIRQFPGKKIGIDISLWIYQAFYSLMDYSGDDSMFVIRNIERKIKLFEEHNITVV